MNYHILGRSGLRVSELCLGTMTFGEEWGWGANRDEARRIYEAYRSAFHDFEPERVAAMSDGDPGESQGREEAAA